MKEENKKQESLQYVASTSFGMVYATNCQAIMKGVLLAKQDFLTRLSNDHCNLKEDSRVH